MDNRPNSQLNRVERKPQRIVLQGSEIVQFYRTEAQGCDYYEGEEKEVENNGSD